MGNSSTPICTSVYPPLTQPSTVRKSAQPSAISHQPSAISHQPSAISHQPSACVGTLTTRPRTALAARTDSDDTALAARLTRQCTGCAGTRLSSCAGIGVALPVALMGRCSPAALIGVASDWSSPVPQYPHCTLERSLSNTFQTCFKVITVKTVTPLDRVSDSRQDPSRIFSHNDEFRLVLVFAGDVDPDFDGR